MSTERTTKADLQRAVLAHDYALATVGIPARRLLLQHEGGVAFRLYEQGASGDAWIDPPVGGSYLGRTAREAYETLTARTRAVYDVTEALHRAGRLTILTTASQSGE